jgi:hypothetical protein
MEQPTNPLSLIARRGEEARKEADFKAAQKQAETTQALWQLVQKAQYVGETLRMDFRNVVIQVNDHQRREVGGIPHLSYLVASRIQNWKSPVDWTKEDSSVLLLRVLGAAPMPNDLMDNIVRSETARRAIGSDTPHWDAKDFMDGYTRYQLSFAGLACEVVGTFYLGQNDKEGSTEPLKLYFGTDINNFYPNRGLKVYKPVEEALASIVNFRDPDLTPDHKLKDYTVPIGHVRYASTNRPMQGVDNVSVSIAPLDMLAQRTALFGMSRTGKSNTTKIIARAIYNLRRAETQQVKVGQLIFDYNGEYANENTQGGGNIKANALKNVWREQDGKINDVITYGLSKPEKEVPGDERRLLRINVYGNKLASYEDWKDRTKVVEAMDMLIVSKNILGDLLSEDSAKYIENFCEVDLSVPENIADGGKQNRYRRIILIYRALLNKAGLEVPAELSKPSIKGLGGNSLFGAELIEALRKPKGKDEARNATYAVAADVLDAGKENDFIEAEDGSMHPNLSWDRLSSAFESLEYFIRKDGAYKDFNANHIKSSKTGDWADQNLLRIIGMFQYANGPRAVARLSAYHEPNNSNDFAQQIYLELSKGNLVIIDQSGGEPSMNDAAARRIMWTVFKKNQNEFINGRAAPDILVYVEEAHNLLPPSKSEDTKDVWVRTAKEGSKYRIGLVYATQEVSSIQKNILKNTANWFIAHLNNTDETKELKKFYDFANFEDSILRAQNRGFLRVKMLSNPYINPVQIQLFVLDIPGAKDDDNTVNASVTDAA